MPKTREQKEEIIEELKEIFSDDTDKLLVDFEGVDSDSLFSFRDKLQENDCSLRVVKKTLLEKALERAGEKELAEKVRSIQRQIALVFGDADKITKAKLSYNFSEENENLGIIGGIGEKGFIEEDTIIELAKLPSVEELYAKLVGTIKNPVRGFVNSLGGNLKGLVYSLNAIKEAK